MTQTPGKLIKYWNFERQCWTYTIEEDPDEYQRDWDEYNEEMSIGGLPYREGQSNE